MLHLAAVAGSHDEEIGFCSYCGRLDNEGQRVCSECGLGVQLHTDASVLRAPGSSFLVVRGDGIIGSVSASAEHLLGNVVGRHVGTVLTSAELLPAVVRAAAGRPGPTSFRVDRMTVTVAPCGLPPAALVLLERM